MGFTIFQGPQEGENKFVYFVSYGMQAVNNSFYSPNLIKANIQDRLGKSVKIKFEKHYRRKMDMGNSFRVHVMFPSRAK